ncbi:hypothetical protein FA95DRAFT_1564745 [Auriscalpium vulgare]|uniref:Uncharacterized protein n=1 Tax=Auriscalpium vulgare TaxID=40419 RepID=A0ACB8RDS7_9AGAM|nr:hypothetical protein FA95DRAFT_1564745 [Auriscalpium vulgare]
MALVPSTAPVIQAQALADLQASVAALQGMMLQLKDQLTALTADVDAQNATLNGKVDDLTANVAANDVSLQELKRTVTLLDWKSEAANICARNSRLRLNDNITAIPVHPGEPAWPENFVYPNSRREILSLSNDSLKLILRRYRLPTDGHVLDKQCRLAVFICGIQE